ncbi:uncharacterized protein HKW66_Vig0082560 [Vigna angularis]|uniref:Uncharacterized protein n=1 Tax=Phaseolus angularis TaxID=3914 RepID=A0A8T0KJP4_PHAAN|nr:uncharacterized protein HKW66_Vig0082560 [Vigna angularis]
MTELAKGLPSNWQRTSALASARPHSASAPHDASASPYRTVDHSTIATRLPLPSTHVLPDCPCRSSLLQRTFAPCHTRRSVSGCQALLSPMCPAGVARPPAATWTPRGRTFSEA